MKILKIKNVYGYPSLSPEFRAWASGKFDLAIGVHNIEHCKRKREFLIVVTGLSYLHVAGVPILGWTYTKGSGIWTRHGLPDAGSLVSNEARIEVPKYNNIPTTKQLYDFYVNNVEEGLSKSFMRMQVPLCYNDRVFNSKVKPV